MFINLYRGKEDKIWAGRTIFNTVEEAQSVPCATREAYVKTVELKDTGYESFTAGRPAD